MLPLIFGRQNPPVFEKAQRPCTIDAAAIFALCCGREKSDRVFQGRDCLMRMRLFGLTIALALAAGRPINSTLADDYPSHPIRLIVPFAAGGAADAVARIVSKHVGDAFGQTVVVENRGGGGGIIAA